MLISKSDGEVTLDLLRKLSIDADLGKLALIGNRGRSALKLLIRCAGSTALWQESRRASGDQNFRSSAAQALKMPQQVSSRNLSHKAFKSIKKSRSA